MDNRAKAAWAKLAGIMAVGIPTIGTTNMGIEGYNNPNPDPRYLWAFGVTMLAGCVFAAARVGIVRSMGRDNFQPGR